MRATRLPGSFRDPAGHVFITNGTLYRRIQPAGAAAYRRLMESGLYAALVADSVLLPHEEIDPAAALEERGTIVIRPERVAMVSYPYEWCFSQLQDAALLTLYVQRTALKFGMSLKDASAYNVQFHRGRPVFIDTLSFEPHRSGPWIAYRQFCQQFYAPLLLWARADPRLGRLPQMFVDGVPLTLASKLLPRRSWARPGPLFHVHLHAAAERKLGQRESGAAGSNAAKAGARGGMDALLDSLERAVRAERWMPRSEWASYYEERPSYDAATFSAKLDTVAKWLDRLAPAAVWDLGANTGRFTMMAAQRGADVVAFDADPACVEMIYRQAKEARLDRVLPLVTDLANPSPAIGWANEERQTLEQRGPAQVTLALALVHHLAIANNVPLVDVASYLSRLAVHTIVEFVPKSDPMVRAMLAGREDIFNQYSEAGFEEAFAARFTIAERVALSPSERTLYLMTAR